jgi:hypothetical protein
MVVRDTFDARKHHQYALRYHFAPECSVTADASAIAAIDGAGSELSIRVFGQTETNARVEDGWVSRCYGQRESASVAVFEVEGHGPQEFVSFIASQDSCRGGSPWPPQIEIAKGASDQSGAAAEGRPYMAYSIGDDEARDVILIADRTDEIDCENLGATGSMAWGRFIKGEFLRGCLIDGNRFEIANRISFTAPAKATCCAFELDKDQLEITIHGATRFDLFLSIPPGVIVLNGSRFDLSPNFRALSFALEGSVWKLADKAHKDDKD